MRRFVSALTLGAVTCAWAVAAQAPAPKPTPATPVPARKAGPAPARKPSAVPDLGALSFPNSGAPSAQAAFLRGVAWLHSFGYEEAIDAFREAQKIDPDFTMA